MKKFLIMFAMSLSTVAAFSNCVYTQNSQFPVAFNDAKKFKTSIRNMDVLVSLTNVGNDVPDDKKINARAIQDFRGRYTSAANFNWYKDANGLMFYFIQDGYGNRVFYDNKGRWQSSLVIYNEDKLPRDIRASVKSVYFDMTITIVKEVQTLDGLAYVVYLEDKSNIKILRVNDQGQMETLSELVK